MNRLNREQAIAAVGNELVESLDFANCEPTGRVGFNGKCQGDAQIEWSASVSFKDADGFNCHLVAYYYTTEDDELYAAESGWDSINWVIDGYTIN